MSLPYMPFYVDDYEAHTAHLTLAEDGAYNRLLRLCWRTPGCTIPNDRTWIKRQMRADEDTYENVVQPIIDEFFLTEKARLFSKRQLEIYHAAKETHEKRSLAGKKGGRPAKTLKNNNSGESQAKARTKPGQSNQNQNHKENTKRKFSDCFKDIRGDVRMESGSDEAAAWLAWLRSEGRRCPNPLNGFFYFKTKLPPQNSEAT